LKENAMAHHLPTITCHALLLASASAIAQNNTVLITSPAAQQVSGFENLSLREVPFSATNVDSATLRDVGAQRISDALRLDSSVTDSYNSPPIGTCSVCGASCWTTVTTTAAKACQLAQKP
jgi:iron complex outermembrane recepter protein